jgi:hypothetical protein
MEERMNLRVGVSIMALTSFLLISCSEPDIAYESLPDDSSDESSNNPDRENASESEPEIITSPDQEISEPELLPESYSHLDPDKIIDPALLAKTMAFYDSNKSRFTNNRHAAIIDFRKSSKLKRFFIINLNTGAVWALHTAHGKGSDSNHDGYAEKFSNKSGSNASSVGPYKAAETYSGKHGYSLRLDGLSTTNSNARSRAVVIHGANYVQDRSVIQGRSWGCPAISMQNRTRVIDLLKGGTLLYAFGPR